MVTNELSDHMIVTLVHERGKTGLSDPQILTK